VSNVDVADLCKDDEVYNYPSETPVDAWRVAGTDKWARQILGCSWPIFQRNCAGE